MTHPLQFDIKLGVASAAAQIEGGDIDHNWKDWYEQGRIKDGATPARANDHRNRWKEDIDLMADMGIKHYRLSLDWARLETAQGVFNATETTWYKELIKYMKSKGIVPLLTLHHFSTPMWFEEMGGFTKPRNIPLFLDYVTFVIRHLGDLVNEYITINEPNVYATMGYQQGVFPPGKSSIPLSLKVQSVLATCHLDAYELIHQLRTDMGFDDTLVGFAHHMRVFEPKEKGNPWHWFTAKLVSYLFQNGLMRAALSAWFDFPFKQYSNHAPDVKADFIGLNYYTRSAISGLRDGMFDDVPTNDLGWEIYPEGIVRCAKTLHDFMPNVPIYITENGTCDNQDAFRSRYIFEHIKALTESGLPVERYYHWCFTDNFEWCEGESARFGLVHVDYETQQRSVKKSGRFYSEMLKHQGVTQAMYREYIEAEQYIALRI